MFARLAAALAFLTLTTTASAATVVLKSGEILEGEVVEMVSGERVVVRLPGGALRPIAWSDVFALRSGAPASAPVAQPFAPPRDVESDGKPSSAALELGARVGANIPGGDLLRDVPASNLLRPGPTLQLHAGVRFSPSWTFFGGYEYGSFEHGSRWSSAADAPSTHAVTVGFRGVTTPRGSVGFLFEIGGGWRWLNFTAGNNKSVAGGPILLRTAFGVSLSAGRTRFDLAYSTSVGMLTSFDLSKGCVSSNADTCDTIGGDDRAIHTVHAITLGTRF